MTDKLPTNSRLLPNDLVLVTGARGYIGSSITEQLLSQGLRVRGTARDVSQLRPMQEKIESTFGKDRFEVLEVKDFSASNAYEGAVKGVSGIIHVATASFSGAEIERLLETEVQAVKNLLDLASKTSSVKAFVFCSSAITALKPDLANLGHVTKDMWNEEAITLATSASQDDPGAGRFAYAAAKTKAEQFCFDYCSKNKLNFSCNAVLPFLALGAKFNPAPGNYSSHTATIKYYEGEIGVTLFIWAGPNLFISVSDLAKLHVIALLDPEINLTRIWGSGGWVSAHELERIIKKHYPNQKLVDISHIPTETNFSIDDKLELDLLKKHYGKVPDELEPLVLEIIKQA